MRDELQRHAPFREDRAAAVELAREAVPVVDAIVGGCDAAGGPMPDALPLREALALVGLLGRRAGEAGLTPTALVALPAALRAGCEAVAAMPVDAAPADAAPRRPATWGAALEEAVRALALEGYVAGREERVVARLAARAASALEPLWIAPRCALLALSGEHDADHLRDVVERAGRALLAGDARALVVSLRGLVGASPTAAAEVFALADVAAMLGAVCVFCDVDETWRRAAAPRIDLARLRIAGDTRAAVAEALDAAGHRLRPKGLRGLLSTR